jgi:hypothetical protein
MLTPPLDTPIRIARKRRPRLRAMTLAEVMVTVALSTIVMGVVTSLLVGLRTRDRDLRDHAIQREHSLRLIETLRSDIRAGSDVTSANERMLRIRSDGNTQVQYELVAEGCRRIETTSDGSTSSSDLFSIGPAASWAIDGRDNGRRPMLAITLQRASSEPAKPASPLVVYAIEGADSPPTGEGTADE